MRIVIDLQGAQCKSRDRGIGRYSLALAKAMVRNRGSHEVIIALSDLFPETIEHVRAAFDGLLPQDNIRVWAALGPTDAVDTANTWRRHTAEFIRESFLASLQPDIVHITSLFDGSYDNAVHSIGLSQDIPTAVTFYDLIPLIQSDVYLTPNPKFEAIYREKLRHLSRADLYLAISESSRCEAIEQLKIAPEKAVNIAAAADDHFKPVYISESEEHALRKHFGLTRPFVMYSGATDERKNHLRLIKAFSLLESELRKDYQLAIVGKLPDVDREKFEEYAKLCGLKSTDVIITGQVSDDEMVRLYNLCDLFVFPSWHEGFGLPALEAMSCGAPVIGADTTSLPEVIGRSDALFDPFDEKSIAKKITEVLTNDDLRAELAQHGLKQAKMFSWDESARRAITAFEQFHAKRHQGSQSHDSLPRSRPKLAYISPLPPERSGISDYSAELLPELSRHYDIDVIVAQETITDAWIMANCSVRDVGWFVKNSHSYDRVLYHFGNSHFHQHMFDLLAKIPGVVVLHDFFLSGIVAHMDVSGFNPNVWRRELYHAHGYNAVQELCHSTDWDKEVFKYPCNKTVLENVQGVIVHSDHSRRLAGQWLGKTFAKDWSVIPLLRVPAMSDTRADARRALGLDIDTFIVSTFGMLAPTKQNQRLLDAWLASPLSKDKRCLLVFVGENHGGGYGADLASTIRDSGLADHRISITGWTDTAQFRQYLAASDVGVQLRTHSRGETSAAVLDCMNYGLPTIVNANGSMADLSADAVWMLPDEFDDAELSKALETLWRDKEKRNGLGARAREVIMTQHAPHSCASQYAESIEAYYEKAQAGVGSLIKAIAKLECGSTVDYEWLAVAQAIANNQPPPALKQLLVDVSALVNHDLKTGIERVVRSILAELLNNPPLGFRVEPVYASGHEAGYRYARQFTSKFLGCPDDIFTDDVIEVFNGDVFLGLDLQQDIVTRQAAFYQHLRHIGAHVYFTIYDLLPVLSPEVFPEGASTMHASWLNTIQQADGVVCISRAVANEMIDWLSEFGTERLRPLNVGWFHLGADITSSAPTIGLPADANKVLATICSRPTFLMVGTIEPRKGHLQTLAAFEQLWAQGIEINLVIVGYEGWRGLQDNQRRTIPKIIHNILNHPELNHRLYWLNGISDEYLENIYANSDCLIAGSEGEGFGLPLIEAAQHKLPIIARDIPVFREVAGDNAYYFSGLEASDLANAVNDWLTLNNAEKSPQSNTMPWLTWKQSTQNLLDVILGNQWYQQWMPDSIQRFWGSDSRLGSQVGKHVGRNIETTGQAGYLIFGPYMPLVAGHYQVVIRGALGKNGAAGARMDVVVDKSTLVVAESALHKSDMDGCLVSLQISLDAPCTDLEVRVWVEATSDVTISLLEIQPASEIENSLHLPLAEVVAIAPQHKESNLAAIKPKTTVLKIQALHQVPLTKNAKRKKRR